MPATDNVTSSHDDATTVALPLRRCTAFVTAAGMLLALALAAFEQTRTVAIAAGVSVIGFWVVVASVPRCSSLFIAVGLGGVDLNKFSTAREPDGLTLKRPVSGVQLPEAMGVVAGATHMACCAVLVPALCMGLRANASRERSNAFFIRPFSSSHDSYDAAPTTSSPLAEFPGLTALLLNYLAALLAVASMCFLGFTDNVLGLRWRWKILMPALASLPVVAVYHSVGGDTGAHYPGLGSLLPPPLVLALEARLVEGLGGIGLHASTPWIRSAVHFVCFGGYIELGSFVYSLVLVLVVIFSTNAINIHAGVNGLEAGQAVVVGIAILAHNVLSISAESSARGRELGTNPHTLEGHTFSAFVMLPFIFSSLGLLVHNWFPAKCFVGDTYCYFAGICLVVAGILGHFTKTLLLLLVPQLANFVLSLPQLARVLPCPRHRLPELCGLGAGGVEVVRASGFLCRWGPGRAPVGMARARARHDGARMTEAAASSSATLLPTVPAIGAVGRFSIRVAALLGVVRVEVVGEVSDEAGSERSKVLRVTNFTLISAVLVASGDCLREESLCKLLLGLQAVWSLVALGLRYGAAKVLFAKGAL